MVDKFRGSEYIFNSSRIPPSGYKQSKLEERTRGDMFKKQQKQIVAGENKKGY